MSASWFSAWFVTVWRLINAVERGYQSAGQSVALSEGLSVEGCQKAISKWVPVSCQWEGVTEMLSVRWCHWDAVSERVSLKCCQWKAVSETVKKRLSVRGCQWHAVIEMLSVIGCQWRVSVSGSHWDDVGDRLSVRCCKRGAVSTVGRALSTKRIALLRARRSSSGFVSQSVCRWSIPCLIRQHPVFSSIAVRSDNRGNAADHVFLPYSSVTWRSVGRDLSGCRGYLGRPPLEGKAVYVLFILMNEKDWSP